MIIRPKNKTMDLSSNESPFSPPFQIRAKLNHYPDEEILREEIAKKHGLKKENILLGNGSIEILANIIRELGPNSKAISFYESSFFVLLENFIKNHTKTIKKIPINPDLTRSIPKNPKKEIENSLFLLDNPSNPLGHCFSLKEIEKMAPYPKYMVVDEAYFEFSGITAIPLIKKFPIIVLRTFSKAHSLAGLRIGYCIAHEEIIRKLEKWKIPHTLNAVALDLAEQSLHSDWWKNTVNYIEREKKYIQKQLKKEKIPFHMDKGNFYLVPINVQKFKRIHAKEAYGIPEMTRISVGTHEQNKEAIKEIKRIWKEKAKQKDKKSKR